MDKKALSRPLVLSLGGREYVVGVIPRCVGREIRRSLQGIVELQGKTPEEIAPQVMARLDDCIDSLRHVPALGADWDRIEKEVAEQELAEAAMEVIGIALAPFSTMAAGVGRAISGTTP